MGNGMKVATSPEAVSDDDEDVSSMDESGAMDEGDNADLAASVFERQRRLAINKNQALLADLGLQKCSEMVPAFVPKQRPKKRAIKRGEDDDDDYVPENTPPRQSGRIRTQRRPYSGESSDDDYAPRSKHAKGVRRLGIGGYTLEHSACSTSFGTLPYRAFDKKVFGAIPDVPVGSLFRYRMDANKAGVHRPTVAGIHGDETEGCYSIAVSGGYPEDRDDGDRIVFTGSGGRDLKGTKAQPKNLRTAPQSRDMELNTCNRSLIASYKLQKPIRVMRGHKSHYHWAPIDCYRYDGLYVCTGYAYEKGSSMYNVYRFTLERLPGQTPLESLPRSFEDKAWKEIDLSIRQATLRAIVEESADHTAESKTLNLNARKPQAKTKRVQAKANEPVEGIKQRNGLVPVVRTRSRREAAPSNEPDDVVATTLPIAPLRPTQNLRSTRVASRNGASQSWSQEDEVSPLSDLTSRAENAPRTSTEGDQVHKLVHAVEAIPSDEKLSADALSRKPSTRSASKRNNVCEGVVTPQSDTDLLKPDGFELRNWDALPVISKQYIISKFKKGVPRMLQHPFEFHDNKETPRRNRKN